MDSFLNVCHLLLEGLIDGSFSTWFFSVFLGNISLIFIRNFALIYGAAQAFVWFSGFTDNTKDDKISAWLLKKIESYRPNSIVKTNTSDQKTPEKPISKSYP